MSQVTKLALATGVILATAIPGVIAVSACGNTTTVIYLDSGPGSSGSGGGSSSGSGTSSSSGTSSGGSSGGASGSGSGTGSSGGGSSGGGSGGSSGSSTSSSSGSTSGGSTSSGGSSGGSTSGSGSSSGSGGDAGGGCTINPAFGAATCPACAACLAPYCCGPINACYADHGCLGIVTCVLACYNGVLPDGGMYDAGNSDPCTALCLANDAGVTSNTLYTTQDNCQNNGTPGTVCNGMAPDAACMCN